VGVGVGVGVEGRAQVESGRRNEDDRELKFSPKARTFRRPLMATIVTVINLILNATVMSWMDEVLL